MVKKLLEDPTPVSRSFLLKTVTAMITIIGTMLFFSFQAGGWLGNYSRLSKIPVSDIEKAVKYSVYEKDERKDFYRDYIAKNDLKNQDQDSDIRFLKEFSIEFRTETRQNIKEIKESMKRIEQSLNGK